MNPVIIFGSSRSDGNTKQLVEVITEQVEIDKVYDLNDYNIGYFDYSFDYKNDDYLSLMEDILKYDELIIVSPVYWYALSAQLKTFFDRFSDLLKSRKDLGYKLKGKKLYFISCGYDKQVYKGFETPVILTCKYLGMEYKGTFYISIQNDKITKTIKEKIRKKLQKLIPSPGLLS